MEQLVFNEELAYHRAPIGSHFFAETMAGPTLMRVGTSEQKKEYLPRILAGEITFCLGYTEPGAGSDLASLQTRALAKGDDYVINGQKMFITLAQHAHYCLLAARTDTDAPKHRGISLFIIDMKTPGITVRPTSTIGDMAVNDLFLDDVRVPKDALVGERNNGWYQLAMALDYERSMIGTAAGNQRLIEELIEYVKEAGSSGASDGGDQLIKDEIAELVVENEVLRMMCYRIAWMYTKGQHPSYESSMSLLFSSDLLRRTAKTGMRVLGHYGELGQDSKLAVARARMERTYLSCLSIGVGGGTNEIQKNIVAMRGLGLPRQQ